MEIACSASPVVPPVQAVSRRESVYKHLAFYANESNSETQTVKDRVLRRIRGKGVAGEIRPSRPSVEKQPMEDVHSCSPFTLDIGSTGCNLPSRGFRGLVFRVRTQLPTCGPPRWSIGG